MAEEDKRGHWGSNSAATKSLFIAADSTGKIFLDSSKQEADLKGSYTMRTTILVPPAPPLVRLLFLCPSVLLSLDSGGGRSNSEDDNRQTPSKPALRLIRC